MTINTATHTNQSTSDPHTALCSVRTAGNQWTKPQGNVFTSYLSIILIVIEEQKYGYEADIFPEAS